MEAQKCRLCGKRHPLGPCPAFAVNKLQDLAFNKPKTEAVNAGLGGEKAAPTLDAVNKKCQSHTEETPSYCRNDRRADAGKRREYMRRYMASWRAIKNGR